MVRKLLLAGMVVGIVAGVFAFVVAQTVGEPGIEAAIAFEGVVGAAGHGAGAEEPELVSRAVQSTVGLGAGVILYGVAFGGIFALVFTLAYGRLGTLSARGTAAALGVVGFMAVSLAPFFKYPPTPPAVGDPNTITRRTTLYLAMIVISVAAAVIAAAARGRLRERLGDWYATIAVGAAYVLVVVLTYVALPGVNDVAQVAIVGVTDGVGDAGITFPPLVLWRFRIASIAIQAVMWATIAIGFGYVATSLLERGAREPARAPVAVG